MDLCSSREISIMRNEQDTQVSAQVGTSISMLQAQCADWNGVICDT